MRVALFFDGKNHMKDLRRAAGDRWLDHESLARWTVEHVGGTQMFAAFYYTGVPTPQDEGQERHALTDLLDDLETKQGFFVRRFNRRASTRECPHCNNVIAYTEEKMVDTSLVADLITYAVRDAFDIAVVFSGDLDVAPGLQAVHALGKRAWIATFGENGLSRALMRVAWGTIDLLEHLDSFSFAELITPPVEKIPETPEEVDLQMLRELRRAQAHFAAGGGFVGAHYFIHRWKGHHIPDVPDLRRQSLQRLMAAQQVETYVSEGKTALRAVSEGGEVEDLFVTDSEEMVPLPGLGDDILQTLPTTMTPKAEVITPRVGTMARSVVGTTVTVRRSPPPPPSPAPLEPVEAPPKQEEDETVEVRLTESMRRLRRQAQEEND